MNQLDSVDDKMKSQDLITTEMRMELVDKVKKLSNEGLTKLVKYVRDSAPNAFQELQDQRVQIRVNLLDKDSFNETLEFIEGILLNE